MQDCFNQVICIPSAASILMPYIQLEGGLLYNAIFNIALYIIIGKN